MGVHGQERQQGNDAAPDCGICHGDAHQIPLPGTTPFRRATIETCGMCHFEQAEQFQKSIHGQGLTNGIRQAPTCTSYHGEHAIQRPSEPASPTNIIHVRETCAECHGDLALTQDVGLPADRIVSYDASFHGLALRAGSQTVANCASCHGIHDILPSTDPNSKIHPSNLPDTCGSCHPGAGSRFSLGPVHVVEGQGGAPVADFIRNIYLVLIPLVIGLMFLHNLGDWVRKVLGRLKAEVPVRVVPKLEIRMYPLERVQHGLLVVSFVVLTWTGLALKFPDHFWAYPLVVWESSWPVRGTVHRMAAVVFLASAGLHVVTLLFSRRLRRHWKQLWPGRADVWEGLAGLTYNLGLRRKEPKISSHSYIEKAEYWAVVWGAVLMSVSGVILWANDFFLTWLPKTAMDVATVVHYYEAILAALAIVVWHFYFVIFDPTVYPMNMAWLTGHGPARLSPAVTNQTSAVEGGGETGNESSDNTPKAGS